jgi:uroporphyrinogen-III decarboxylase
MTSRERLQRLFTNQEIDRIPIWLLYPYHPLGCYTDVYKNPYYKPILPYIEKYCDTFDRRSYPASHFCFNGNPEIIQETVQETINGYLTEVRQIRCGKNIFRRFVETTPMGKTIRHFIDDPQMLKDIAAVPYMFPEPDFGTIYKERDDLGDKGLLMMDLGDPLVPLYYLVSAEDFAVWSLTDYDTMLEFTDLMYQRCLAMYKACLEKNVGDVFFIVGTEFAGPPLVSPQKFNELSVRFVKGIVDLIRSYGKYSIVHYHGNLFKVLTGMKEIDPDGLHTIEAPPVGDCTIKQARAALGNMILIGNIQYDDLRSRTPEDIDAMVKDAIAEAEGGRFILSPTAGPYEEVIDDNQVKNYIAFIEAGFKYGRKYYGKK